MIPIFSSSINYHTGWNRNVIHTFKKRWNSFGDYQKIEYLTNTEKKEKEDEETIKTTDQHQVNDKIAVNAAGVKGYFVEELKDVDCLFCTAIY